MMSLIEKWKKILKSGNPDYICNVKTTDMIEADLRKVIKNFPTYLCCTQCDDNRGCKNIDHHNEAMLEWWKKEFFGDEKK